MCQRLHLLFLQEVTSLSVYHLNFWNPKHFTEFNGQYFSAAFQNIYFSPSGRYHNHMGIIQRPSQPPEISIHVVKTNKSNSKE